VGSKGTVPEEGTAQKRKKEKEKKIMRCGTRGTRHPCGPIMFVSK
jgi:hypothetical protein